MGILTGDRWCSVKEIEMTDEFTQAVAELDSPIARMLEEKDAEIERLKAELTKWTDLFSEWDSPADVHEALIGLNKDMNALKAELSKYQASDEMLNECCSDLDRRKAERDAAIKEIGKWAREAGASQAREAKLREALESLAKLGNGGVFGSSLGNQMAFNAFCLPYDDTALKEAIKQGQREVLMEAADLCEGYTWADSVQKSIRRMAEEIK
jgi:uncharacterized small protein (DUF1192 family)